MTIELPEGAKITKLPVRKSNKIGRPRKYEKAKDLQKAVDAYFDWIDEQNEIYRANRMAQKPPTVAGLTRSVGFFSRTSLWRMKEAGPDFRNVLDGAKQRIEEYMETVVSSNPSFAAGWLRKNVPEEWGDPEGDAEQQGSLVADGTPVTIKIEKQYGKVEEDG